VIRAIYELDPPEAAETLALIESVGRADGPEPGSYTPLTLPTIRLV
jgi:hypothetical protein